MALWKSFSCLSGTFCVRHALEIKSKNKALLSYCKAFNGKRLFKTEVAVRARIRNRRNSTNQESVVFRNFLKCRKTENRSLSMGMLWKPLIFTLALSIIKLNRVVADMMPDTLQIRNRWILPILIGGISFTNFSAGSFAGCAIWQYENMRRHAISIRKGFSYWYPDKLLQRNEKKSSWKNELSKMWNDLSEAEKLFVPICAANVMVLLAWRIPKFQRAMFTYFSSHPRSNAVCWPLILSAFSHCSAIHLGVNMYALNSFTKIGVASLGKEQFLCLYLTGGVISSFTSLCFKVIKNKHGLSVGASGAIMTVVGYICTKYPDMELSIVGFPWLTFTGGSGLKALLAFDLAGMILGWKLFDHAAHLGGAFFGIFWCIWGHWYIWHKKDTPLQWWHKFRSSV